MQRLALLMLAVFTTACASAVSTQVINANPSIAGPTALPLRKPAQDLFAAAAQPRPMGISLSIDFDAMRSRGLIPTKEELPGGYTLVQSIAPFIGELTIVSSEWTKPLSEALVFATLIDRAIPFPQIKRLGFFVQGEQIFDMDFDEVLQKSVLLLGVDTDQVEAKKLLESYAAIVRAARPSLAEIMVAADMELDSADIVMQGDSLCAIEAAGKAPLACLLGGDGVYALGSPAAIESLAAQAAAGTNVAPGPHFARTLLMFEESMRMEILMNGEADLDVAISLDVPDDEETGQEIVQMANMFMARRQQARREFDMSTALALQNVQHALAQDPKAPAHLKEVAAGLTLDTIYDPYGTGLMNPDNVTLTQVGSQFVLKIHFPDAYVNHAIITSRNASPIAQMLGLTAFHVFKRVLD